ncbi:hypothetical protein AMTR_s00026p00183780 [Amborella trichopoda]|uniref:Uncharacterized protein n=1 Tax=Amborella trichopoda TaxID=13333 RepID=W1PRF3_AMBTC|nr:hypothetical protein AMTR_s00026p00183780 [Amborella trichopoda]
MTPWIDEWRDRTADVIGEEKEEESICLSLYDEKYRVVLRDVAALIDHGARFACKDLESLCHNFEGMREARDMAEVEHDSIKNELERVQAELERLRSIPSSSVVVPTLPGPSPVLIEDLERCLDCYRSDASLADANPYVRVPLPSSAWSQPQFWASTRMMRSPRWVR